MIKSLNGSPVPTESLLPALACWSQGWRRRVGRAVLSCLPFRAAGQSVQCCELAGPGSSIGVGTSAHSQQPWEAGCNTAQHE